MRVSVNLASRPFVEIRPLLARLRLLMALLAVLAVGLAFWLGSLSRRATAMQAGIDTVQAQTNALQRQRAANEARMRQPVNRDVLDRSHFLNALFLRKSFSWTGVMMDLERVLPPGVQVTSIDPQISKEGEVTIRLRVSGSRDRAVQLVRNLEHSSRFLGPRLASENTQANEAAARQAAFRSGAPAGGPSGVQYGAEFRPVPVDPNLPALPTTVEFDILSGYNPLPEPNGRPVIRSEPPSAAERSAAARSALAPSARRKP